MPNLPSGTVTFAFSDIEGSTELLKRLGDERYAELLRGHRRLVRESFAAHAGQEIDTQGDAFFYSFPRARDAVAGAVVAQRAHEQQAWPEGVKVRVRIGLHTGEPQIGEEGYSGLDVVRAARIAAVARGGQVLLSDTTRALLGAAVPEGVEVREVGRRRLKDIDEPEDLHELRIDGVEVAAAADASMLVADTQRRDPPLTRTPGAAPAPPPPPLPVPPSEIASIGTADVDGAHRESRASVLDTPDLRSIFAGLPAFVREAAEAERAQAGSARDVIEQRVLSELRDVLPDAGRRPPKRGSRKRQRDRDRLPADRQGASPTTSSGESAIGSGSGDDHVTRQPSVASELERLQALRRAGSLTDEQYARAVDRVLDRGA